MNVRKPVDYGMMYRELTAILAQNLPQMGEIYAIGKVISQHPEKGAAVAAAEFLQANFPDRTGFSPRGNHGSGTDKRRTQVVSGTGAGAAVVKKRTAGHSQQRL